MYKLNHLDRKKVKVKSVFDNGKLLVVQSDNDEFMVKGNFQYIYPEDKLLLFGSFKQNKSIGRYFNTHFYREFINAFWIGKWLKLFKNLSDKEIINLLIYENNSDIIKKEWDDILVLQEIFKVLKKNGITDDIIAHLELRFKYNPNELYQDPYVLLNYPVIHTTLVEELVSAFPVFSNNSSKANHLLSQLLQKANQRGHLYLPREDVLNELLKYQITLDDVDESKFIITPQTIHSKECYFTEYDVAKNIIDRLQQEKDEATLEMITNWENEKGFNLAQNQKEAVLMALKEPFCVVTGGPGVGKTTTCNCITDLLAKKYSITFVAPTGRAAKRAKESTGLDTQTIHRMLLFDGNGFNKNKDNQIQTDVLVIDESSMVDSELLRAMLEAIPLKTKIIFVGDVDQLPSVGAGQVLKDLIDSNVVPVTRLTEIFRQAADSPIISCAYAVNRSELPKLESHEDLIYIKKDDEEDIKDDTLSISLDLYRKENIFDVQVLIPLYKGPVGIDEINRQIQQRLHPNEKGVKIFDYELRLGDKVIQTRNDYVKGIYNGDVGVVTFCTPSAIRVRFQDSDKETEYFPNDFKDLQLSYAITIHRAQGSEYKFAIIPVAKTHGIMLQKNLLYTAITRAKKKLWMIYDMEALKTAISPESVPPRFTALKKMLQDEKKISA
jgi:exodeoxyribonuclease V alpha subunit